MNNFSRYVAIGFVLLVVGVVFYYFSSIVAYVLIAWVLSLIGQPLMRLFQKEIKMGKFRWRMGPNLASVLTLVCFFVLTFLLFYMFVPLVIEQARNLATVDYTAIANALQEPLGQINERLIEWGLTSANQSAEAQLQEALQGRFEPSMIGNFFGSIVGAAGNLIFAIFSIVFITFFFLKEQGLFVNFLVAIAPNRYEDRIRHGLKSITSLLTRYFGGILLQSTVITIFVSVLLGLLGIKNALLIGFFAGVINVIPYLGPLIGAAFGIFITISSNLDLDFYNEMLPLLLRVVLVFGAMQMLDNFVLQPFIFSNSVLAHPLEIFIIVLVGAQLDGIVGMVLAIPVYTVLRVIARVFLSEFQVVQKLTGGIGDI
ncbi:MAG: AI-2E family transporter [Bacteroidota bacterium]